MNLYKKKTRRLVEAECQNWNSRCHFFAAAAEAMWRILVDNARRKKSLRHAGGHKRVAQDEAVLANEENRLAEQLIALDEALVKLSKKDKVKADLVKLRYFAGLT